MSETGWIPLKLTHLGENADHFIIVENLKRIFGPKVEFFLPYKNPLPSYNKKACVLEGYIFVKDSCYESADVHNSYYFEKVSDSRVSNEEISVLRSRLKELCEAIFFEREYVCITDGPYSNLDGIVLSVNRDTLIIQVELRSKELIIEVPKISVVRYCP